MAQQRNQNQGGGRSRGGGRQICTMCPPGNQKQLPKDRAACYDCLPDWTITARLLSKGEDHQIMVRTFRNNKPAAAKFVRSEDGEFIEETTDVEGKFLLRGIKSTPKEREILFHLLTGEAEDEKVKIPGTTKEPAKETTPPEYELVAIAVKGQTGWSVNLTFYRQVKPQPAYAVECTTDVLDDDDQIYPPVAIPLEGITIGLPFRTRNRKVFFSVATVQEKDGTGSVVVRNPNVDTKPLELEGVNISKAIKRPDYDPAQSVWENIKRGIAGAKGEL